VSIAPQTPVPLNSTTPVATPQVSSAFTSSPAPKTPSETPSPSLSIKVSNVSSQTLVPTNTTTPVATPVPLNTTTTPMATPQVSSASSPSPAAGSPSSQASRTEDDSGSVSPSMTVSPSPTVSIQRATPDTNDTDWYVVGCVALGVGGVLVCLALGLLVIARK
jgi:uncharacterized membrane protein